MRIIRSIIALLALAALSGCETTNLFVDPQAVEGEQELDREFWHSPNYEYHIRKDDKISISVWGQDDLSVGSVYGIYNSNEVYGKWLMVDANGQIELPRIGTMRVENRTIVELKAMLRVRYGEWVREPVVDVKVLNREITVLGEVREPQVIPVDKERSTLLEVIARCRGLEFYANPKAVKVLRQNGEHVHVANIDLTVHGDYAMKNIFIQPGDVVVVPSKKYKAFDRRIATIIPFATTLTSAAVFLGAF